MFANAFLDRLLLLIFESFARFAILELDIQHLDLGLIGSLDHDSKTACTWVAKLLSDWISLDLGEHSAIDSLRRAIVSRR